MPLTRKSPRFVQTQPPHAPALAESLMLSSHLSLNLESLRLRPLTFVSGRCETGPKETYVHLGWVAHDLGLLSGVISSSDASDL